MLLGNTHKKRKVDRGNDFNDYCLIPITNICRVLVLDPTESTILFLFQLTVCHTDYYWSTPHTITTPERNHLCHHFYIVPTAVGDSWRHTVASIICISLL